VGVDDHPSADQPDPIAPPDNPDQPLRGPQWARLALANEHDPATKARRIAEMPQSEFMGSGLFLGDGQEIPEALVVDNEDVGEDDDRAAQEVDQ
jgi:hypothetical protein